MFDTDSERTFAIAAMMYSPYVPYRQLPGRIVPMSSQRFDWLLKANKDKFDLIEYAINIPFNKTTEVSSLILPILDTEQDQETRVALLAGIIGLASEEVQVMTPREHVVLLGDLKGTKSYLSNQSLDARTELTRRLATLHGAFARLVLSYIDRSKTLCAYCFSDSVLVRWDDLTEGARNAPMFAGQLWNELEQAGMRFRIFVDSARSVPVEDDVGHAIQAAVGRYHHVVPISMAVWSVFVAEESHFPDGVFIGESFAAQLQRLGTVLGGTKYEAGPFTFVKMKDGGLTTAR